MTSEHKTHRAEQIQVLSNHIYLHCHQAYLESGEENNLKQKNNARINSICKQHHDSFCKRQGY